MKSISSLIDHRLIFLQPNIFYKKYELRFGNELIGTLESKSLIDTEVLVSSAEGSWIFKHRIFSRSKTTIIDSSTGQAAGSFESGIGKSKNIIHLSSGKDFRAKMNLWRTRLLIMNSGGEEVIQYEEEGLFKRRYLVRFSRPNARISELGLITLFGCYLFLHREQ